MNYYLSLGSNLGDRRRNLARALAALEEAGVRVDRVSSVYHTQPVDFAAQPWFYNLVARIESALPPEVFLSLLLRIEKKMGRVRTRRSGPRPIDIDILLAGSLVVRDSRLTIPHPRLEKRNFVLVPLAEIAPSAVHPVVRKTVFSLLRTSTDRSAVRKLRPLHRPQPASKP
jgi:2-amino-4-hydroxy-6-hydroxymethyldihydropteridine diphosphokinase